MDTSVFSRLEQASTSVISFLQQQVIYSSVLFVVVAIVAWTLRKKSPYWQLGLWSLILLRLVLPTDLGTPWSARSLIGHIPFPETTSVVTISKPPAIMGKQATSILPPDTPNKKTALIGENEIARPVKLSWRCLLFMLWLVGVTGLFIFYFRKLLKFYQLISRATEIEDQTLQRYVTIWKKRFHIRQPVRLVCSDEFLSPFTLGFICPTIFISAQLIESEGLEFTEAFIAHEMAHISRLDDFWIKIQHIIHIIFFFHPVAWYASRQIHQARERLCDQMVLQKGISPKKYGKSMLKVLQNNLFGGMQASIFPGFGNQKQLIITRIHDVIKGEFAKKPTHIFITCMLLILALLLLPMASLSSSNDNQTNQAELISERWSSIPDEIQQFLDDVTRAALNHDIDEIAQFYSEDYLLYGLTKKDRIDRIKKYNPWLTFQEMFFTRCKIKENIALVTGFYRNNWGTHLIPDNSLIKEDGRWKWYGNQKNITFRWDVQAFLNDYARAMEGRNIYEIAQFYSEQYLSNGLNKHQRLERLESQFCKLTGLTILFTDFALKENIASVKGITRYYGGQFPLSGKLIRENGRWKWYGNQKEAISPPQDVQIFLDDFENAIYYHDLDKLTEFYADDYLHNGLTKEAMIGWFESKARETTFFKITLTEFDRQGDNAVIAGAAETQCGSFPIAKNTIIKNDGNWKFYGNQE